MAFDVILGSCLVFCPSIRFVLARLRVCILYFSAARIFPACLQPLIVALIRTLEDQVIPGEEARQAIILRAGRTSNSISSFFLSPHTPL